MKIIVWENLSKSEQKKILARPVTSKKATLEKVREIIDIVRYEGDPALKKFTKYFDGIELKNIAVTSDEIEAAVNNISEKTKNAFKKSAENIQKFHLAQCPKDISIETMPGVRCEMRSRAIQRVGLYIPSGTAPLPSAVLMLGVPAMIAGCEQRILCSPPRKDGSIDPNILFAAQLCGIKTIYKVGGAQAIAAMAYGTETVSKVDKIFGPGNSWVTQAKLLVAQNAEGAGYDIPAGPSEVMVIADQIANPTFIAADLLAQAEHGIDSQVFLVCTCEQLAKRVKEAVEKQLEKLTRKKIAEQALNNSYLLVVFHVEEAIKIANQYAPEHLILQIKDPRNYLNAIQNAGSVFLGAWSPESVGDYASGTNHVLPTYGYARYTSGLSLRDFMKTITFQELSEKGLKNISETVMRLAEIEGFDAHKEAVKIRLNQSSL